MDFYATNSLQLEKVDYNIMILKPTIPDLKFFILKKIDTGFKLLLWYQRKSFF